MSVKVPLFKGDLGGSESDGEGKKTRPSLQSLVPSPVALRQFYCAAQSGSSPA
jgi:hypothetical protein